MIDILKFSFGPKMVYLVQPFLRILKTLYGYRTLQVKKGDNSEYFEKTLFDPRTEGIFTQNLLLLKTNFSSVTA